MTEPLDVLLLLALPASGKSEVRRYLASQSADACRREFFLNPTVQLDDYPYVHMMRRISQELRTLGSDTVFFDSDDLPLKHPRDWGTLIELLNEDFDDLAAARRVAPASASAWLLGRLDTARAKVGLPAALAALPTKIRGALEQAIATDAQKVVADRNAEVPTRLAGHTVVMEFARGGPEGATMPLAAPYGYRHALSLLSDTILSRASILYVWVAPEESRRKNRERADPNDQGSILNHGVPETVMRAEYGCDDMGYLVDASDRPNHVRIESRGKVFHLPLARFDNRVDKTSFVRRDPESWRPEEVKPLHAGLTQALATLARVRG